jgi:hypothetical protein
MQCDDEEDDPKDRDRDIGIEDPAREEKKSQVDT